MRETNKGGHLEGRTSGSQERPSEVLAGTVLAFDLEDELAKLRGEETWERNDHNARTLVKEDNLRIVLLALKEGGTLEAHQAPGRISIHTIFGTVRVNTPEQTVELPTDSLVALDTNVPHSLEALEESAALLTIAWLGRDDEYLG